MINNIIKILNLKYYDIDLEKSYLDDVEQRDFKLPIFFNKSDVLCPICNTKGKLKEYKTSYCLVKKSIRIRMLFHHFNMLTP